jgi:uncharacterized membrane protein YfcA
MPYFIFILSLIASIIGAISGIGGGIIIKPVLDATHTLNITAISLLTGCTVLAMSAVSIARNIRGSITMNLKTSTLLGIGAVIGGILGKELFDKLIQISTINKVGAIQSLILFIITIIIFIYIRFQRNIVTKKITNPLTTGLIGGSLGVTSTFLGIGGGPLNIAILYYFFSMTGKTAVLNSLYVIFISQLAGLLGMFMDHNIPQIDPITLLTMILGGIIGALIGYRMNKNFNDEQVEQYFCIVVGCSAFLNVWNFFHYLQ